ncbi:histidinol-phosphate aminotransferase [Roseivivax lentus]|uniref:Histidinol-phosphate aminotransferase n=1 Tax=Roseivivax lentus TaxID=633194 RepID=A0A1N7PJE4_9RHOB|nr:pyridoxal phosphate-dependent aminotransferase [Roseivivax lentus]SIT10676.1 histidinol-phosphate aminotransferase [Roseivivax lentus]
MTGPRYTRLAETLPSDVPFVGPEVQERRMGRPFRARLGANESVFGPSPKAIEALHAAAPDVWMYADATSHALKQALAAEMGARPENIVIGGGIDGLLGNLVRLLVEPGDPVVTSKGAYPTFNYHVTGFGGMLHKVPFRDDREDLPALIDRARETRAKLIYLSNPDNPMGSWYAGREIEAALDTLPEGTLLLLDEAYIEFAPEGTAPRIDPDDPRVIRMRTFSKARGMAGLRVGYATGAPALIRAFDKVRDHFGMTRPAQAAALAALQDAGWLAQVQDAVAASRDRIGRIGRAHGLTPLPSATNFVALDCGGDGAHAKAVLDALVARGVFVRMPFEAPQNRCIRVSCGRPADLDVFEEVLPLALADVKAAAAG